MTYEEAIDDILYNVRDDFARKLDMRTTRNQNILVLFWAWAVSARTRLGGPLNLKNVKRTGSSLSTSPMLLMVEGLLKSKKNLPPCALSSGSSLGPLSSWIMRRFPCPTSQSGS